MVWLCGLSAGLRTKGSPVQFLVRAHGWAVGCPQWGAGERQPHTDVSLPFSFPSPLPKNKLKIKIKSPSVCGTLLQEPDLTTYQRRGHGSFCPNKAL